MEIAHKLSPDAKKVCRDEWTEQNERIREAITEAKRIGSGKPAFLNFPHQRKSKYKAGGALRAKFLLKKLSKEGL